MFYSVPYQYIKEKVDVRITDSTVEVYSKNERIASHKRLTGRPGQYSTQIDHMPKDHQQYLEWNGDRFRRWAKEVGPNTYKVIDAILASNNVVPSITCCTFVQIYHIYICLLSYSMIIF